MIGPTLGAVSAGHKTASGKTVLAILELFLTRPETQFEPAQSLIGERRSAEVQAVHPFGGAALQGFSHYDVVGTQVLERVIRRAELVDRFRAKMKNER